MNRGLVWANILVFCVLCWTLFLKALIVAWMIALDGL